MPAPRSTHFETLRPVDLYVEIGKGSVQVQAADTTESQVEITGRDAAAVLVEHEGNQLSVIAPQQRGGFLSGDAGLSFVITVPTQSTLSIKSRSADITCRGGFGAGRFKSGSGDVALDTVGPTTIETGSGDISVGAAGELRIKSGSGDVRIASASAAVSVSTGSGDVEVGSSTGPTVVKTGSGDLKITSASADVSLSTGSGDLTIGTVSRGRVSMKGASGGLRIGVPAGVPVWTDISTVSGRIHSTLISTGQPEEGADHVEVRTKTVSGDVVLIQT